MSGLSGFNNHDQFAGTLFFPTNRSDGLCGDVGGYQSSFIFSNSAYVDLGALGGSLFNGPDPCTGWGWPTGIDDAGNVIGWADGADFTPGPVKYDGTTMSYLPSRAFHIQFWRTASCSR